MLHRAVIDHAECEVRIKDLEARVAEREAALIELVHANNDLIDDYTRISATSEKAAELLPDHDFQSPMFTEY